MSPGVQVVEEIEEESVTSCILNMLRPLSTSLASNCKQTQTSVKGKTERASEETTGESFLDFLENRRKGF